MRCAAVYADGMLLGNVTVSAFDVNGLGSPDGAVNSADVALVMAEALKVGLGGTPRARDDYNNSGTVNSQDVAVSISMALQQATGTGSRTTGPFCP